MGETDSTDKKEKKTRIISPTKKQRVLSPTFAAARQARGNNQDRVPQQANSLLQRQCRCGRHTIAGALCDDCQQQAGATPESSAISVRPEAAPIQAHPNRQDGADFSAVPARARVTSTQSTFQASGDIQAQAFNEGIYRPGIEEDRRPLGNELTHVLQQGGRHIQRRELAQRAARSRWASSRQKSSPNVFASRASREAWQDNLGTPAVQRYETSAGFGILGNKVNFKSTNLRGTLAGGLQFIKDATDLEVTSQDYDGTGTVEASGPKDHVKNFELGFLQTVYRSDRTYYYEPEAYSPGVLEQIGTFVAPSLFSSRYKVTDTLTQLPVRDGDAGFVPWYGPEVVQPFDHAATSVKTTDIYDRPGTSFPWKKTVDGKDQYLVKTGGQDIFRSWLSVQKKGTTGFWGMHRLGYIDWKVDYGTSVKVNKANPAASTVTLTTGGGKITGTNEGPGIKLPLMSDPVANDVTTEKEGRW